MQEAVLDIKHWGNDLELRLPPAIAHAARLQADQRVRLSVQGDSVVITPIHDSAPTLEQRLARFDPAKHGGESIAAPDRPGAERW